MSKAFAIDGDDGHKIGINPGFKIASKRFCFTAEFMEPVNKDIGDFEVYACDANTAAILIFSHVYGKQKKSIKDIVSFLSVSEPSNVTSYYMLEKGELRGVNGAAFTAYLEKITRDDEVMSVISGDLEVGDETVDISKSVAAMRLATGNFDGLSGNELRQAKEAAIQGITINKKLTTDQKIGLYNESVSELNRSIKNALPRSDHFEIHPVRFDYDDEAEQAFNAHMMIHHILSQFADGKTDPKGVESGEPAADPSAIDLSATVVNVPVATTTTTTTTA